MYCENTRGAHNVKTAPFSRPLHKRPAQSELCLASRAEKLVWKAMFAWPYARPRKPPRAAPPVTVCPSYSAHFRGRYSWLSSPSHLAQAEAGGSWWLGLNDVVSLQNRAVVDPLNIPSVDFDWLLAVSKVHDDIVVLHVNSNTCKSERELGRRRRREKKGEEGEEGRILASEPRA